MSTFYVGDVIKATIITEKRDETNFIVMMWKYSFYTYNAHKGH